MFKNSFCFIFLFSASCFGASVYQCEIDGEMVFSQMPCEPGAEKIQVSTPKSNTKIKTNHQALSSSTTEQDFKKLKVFQINQEIKRRNTQIQKYHKKRDKELEAIEIKKLYARNNLAGAIYEESLSKEMLSINHKYTALIDDENLKISTLREELANIDI